MHHRHPDFDVADAHSIVDSLTRTSLAVPRIDIRRPELQLEGCRHAVQRLEPISLGRRSVRMKIDEAGCDN